MTQDKEELQRRVGALFDELHEITEGAWTRMNDDGLEDVTAEQVICIALHELTGYITAAALIDGITPSDLARTARLAHTSGVRALGAQHKDDCEDHDCTVAEILGKYLRSFQE